jgi:hypothetical protein
MPINPDLYQLNNEIHNSNITKIKELIPNIDVVDLKKLFATAVEKPEIIPDDMVDYFMHVAEEIVKDKLVLYKRDPVNVGGLYQQ